MKFSHKHVALILSFRLTKNDLYLPLEMSKFLGKKIEETFNQRNNLRSILVEIKF